MESSPEDVNRIQEEVVAHAQVTPPTKTKAEEKGRKVASIGEVKASGGSVGSAGSVGSRVPTWFSSHEPKATKGWYLRES
jgi:hypothetical protein